MPNEIRLEVYTIKIRESRNTKDLLILDDFLGGTDFLTFFQNYVKSFHQQLTINELQKKSLKLDSSNISLDSGQRMISGIIESGDYGYAGKGYNVGTGIPSYNRNPDDTETKPFYFLIYLPKGKDKGFVVLQRMGIYGLHSAFKAHLIKFFKATFQNLQLEFEIFVSPRLAQTFIDKGGIKELEMTSYKLPTDAIERLGLSGHEDIIYKIQIKLFAKRNKFFPFNNRIKNYIKNPNVALFEFRELNTLGFDGDQKSQVLIEYNGKSRMVDLSDSMNLRPYYDIDREVKLDSGGHPVFNSIDALAKEFITDVVKEIYP